MLADTRPIRYDGVCVLEEAAILESHGIEVESPGGLSNSDEVDASDFPEQPCEASLFDKRPSARACGFSRADLSSPTLVPDQPSTPTAASRLHPRVLNLSVPTQVPMVLPSGFPLLARGLSAQRAALIGRSQASAAGTGVSWSPPSPCAQEEASVHLSEPQEPSRLERAAGSHSSPALAHQERATCSNGTAIKTEALEEA